MPVPKLREFLDSNHIRYSTILHSVAYTADMTAALTHISGKELAKTVIVRLDGELAMAVLPASEHIDLRRLKTVTGSESCCIAMEEDFQALFPECQVGAMPPFGNLYGMQVYVDESLTRDKEIAFSAGSHSELIRMSYDDFARLVRPAVAQFAAKAAAKAA
jgi:Ala-tRNA(Pro) deacylase